MISFVTPLVSAQRSADWDFNCRLLARTLQSILAQTDPLFRVVVVCHQSPAIPELDDERVRVEVVDFPGTLSGRDLRFHSDDWTETGETDKGRKLMYGTSVSRALGASHVMFVDADDCISRRIAALVNRTPECSGWKIERGFEYQESGAIVRYKPWRFHRQCGTGLIVRQDLLPNPSHPEYDRGLRYYRTFLGHEHLADDLRRAGHRLTTVPFPGAVYVLHSQNMRAGELIARRSRWNRLSASVRSLFLNRRLSASIRREFQLHSLSDGLPDAVTEGACRAAQRYPPKLPIRV